MVRPTSDSDVSDEDRSTPFPVDKDEFNGSNEYIRTE